MDSPEKPAAPDPVQTAAAQTTSNKQTAIANANLNRIDQYNPYGSQTYTKIGTNEDGTPQYRQDVSFSAPVQGMFDSYINMTKGMGDMGNAQLGQLKGMYAAPFDLNAATNNQLGELQHQYMDPVWNRREAQADNRLIQRGFSVGDEGYKAGMRDFNDTRDRAYLGADINARQQAVQEAMAQRNLPLNEFNAFRSANQVSSPTFNSVPQAQMANTDVAGITNSAFNNQMALYNADMSQNNAMMGGLFGLGSAALMAPMTGGTSLGGLAMGKAAGFLR